MKIAEIHTKKGVMKIKFFEKDAPNPFKNFIDLANKGFYNGLTFAENQDREDVGATDGD